MKRKIMCVVLAIALMGTIAPKQRTYADALTVGMIGQALYGLGSGLGISWAISNNTAQFTTNFMESEINSYENKQTLIDSFAGDELRIVAGKLAIGQTAFNAALDFLNNLKSKYDLSANMIGINNEVFDPQNVAGQLNGWAPYTGGAKNNYGYWWEGWSKDGGLPGSATTPGNWNLTGTKTDYLSNEGRIYYYYERAGSSRTAGPFTKTYTEMGVGNSPKQVESFDFGNYAPEPLPQNKRWEGDFSGTPGFAEPPTDLPDFLSRIPAGIANNDLAVTGEIVDAGGGGGPLPSPSPSPGPSYNKGAIATLIAEILALINSLSGDTAVDQEAIEEVAQQVAEQAQTLPDAISQTGTQTQTAIQDATQSMTDTITQTQTQTQTAIQDATQSMTDTITQTQTQTQTAIQDATQSMTDTITQTQTQTQTAIQDATQTITDTITETQTETKDAIQDQTQEITDIKDAIKDATDVPTRDKWEQVKKDLHGVFPFCIPWDIYGMLTAFSAEPRAPYFEWPFNVPSIGLEYTIDLDFAEFDPVAQTLRTVELIAFSIGLAILTSKVIRW